MNNQSLWQTMTGSLLNASPEWLTGLMLLIPFFLGALGLVITLSYAFWPDIKKGIIWWGWGHYLPNQEIRSRVAIPKTFSRVLALLTISAALVTLVLSLWLIGLYMHDGQELTDFSFSLRFVQLDIHLDALSLFFVLLVNFVTIFASVSSLSTIEARNAQKTNRGKGGAAEILQEPFLFHVFLNMFHCTMLLVAVVNNLVWLWIAIELTTAFSALAVGYLNKRPNWEAAWKYLIITSTGIVLALLGTMFLANAVGTLLNSPQPEIQRVFTENNAIIFDAKGQSAVQDAIMNWTFLMKLAKTGALSEEAGRPFMLLAFLVIVVGYGTKAGLAPIHVWLPDAHGEAPAPMSALLSGVLLKAALYAILRVYTLTNTAINDRTFTSTVLIITGLFSLLVAVPFIQKKNPFKRVLAYHSLEHMGIIVLAVGLAGLLASSTETTAADVAAFVMFGALLHTFNHAITKALMFLSYGNVYQAYGMPEDKEWEGISGILHYMPKTSGILIVGGLALVGMPPFSIFLSEFIIVWGTMDGLLNNIFGQGRQDWRFQLTILAILVFVFSTTLIFYGLIRHLANLIMTRDLTTNTNPAGEERAVGTPRQMFETFIHFVRQWICPQVTETEAATGEDLATPKPRPGETVYRERLRETLPLLLLLMFVVGLGFFIPTFFAGLIRLSASIVLGF